MARETRPGVPGQVVVLDAARRRGVYRDMDQPQFDSFLAAVPVEAGDGGWAEAPAERHITVHAAHDGVPLTVSKVEALRLDGSMVWARTRKGETYLLALSDIFALAVEAPKTSERKAGFAADR